MAMDLVCTSLAFIDGLGTPEMMLIFVIVLVLFGGQKLPEFARGLGKSIREFKKAAAGVEEEFKRALEEDERKNTAPKLTAPAGALATTDPYADPAGPESEVHPPVTDDDVTTYPESQDNVINHPESTEDVTVAESGAPAEKKPEPKILPPAAAPESPAPSAPPPPAGAAPENPS